VRGALTELAQALDAGAAATAYRPRSENAATRAGPVSAKCYSVQLPAARELATGEPKLQGFCGASSPRVPSAKGRSFRAPRFRRE
jgi:hypothetical protein